MALTPVHSAQPFMKNHSFSILLIEDSPTDQLLFKETIAKTCYSFAGISIANNLKDGLSILDKESSDIVLLDLSLPDSQNLEGLKKVRQKHAELPVVILTGFTDPAFGTQSIKAGAQDYLIKGKYDHYLLEKSISYAIERQKNLIDMQQIGQQLREKQKIIEEQNSSLEVNIKERTSDLQHANGKLQELLKEKNEKSKKLKDTLDKLKSTQAQLVQAEKMSSLGRLTAGIAHEINNPLNFISGGANGLELVFQDLLQMFEKCEEHINNDAFTAISKIEELKEEYQYDDLVNDIPQLIKDIALGAERTTEIIENLQHFSRMNNADPDFEDITKCLDSTLLFLKYKLQDKIRIIKSYDQDLPKIPCFPGLLNQVFMNILSNAIQAIDGKGSIRISVKNKRDFVRIGIKDDGKGIPDKLKQKIFDPFFTTKEVGKGVGLGLSICYGIIQMHRGCIKVESEPGKGTEFIIELLKEIQSTPDTRIIADGILLANNLPKSVEP